MKIGKLVTAIVVAMMLLPMLPVVKAASTSISLSVSLGPVDTSVTASGLIDTFNGTWELYFDANGDDVYPLGERLATGTASGYSWSKTVKVPNSYEGAKRFKVFDITAAPVQSSTAFFTVQTKWKVEVDKSSYYQGGGFGAVPAGITLTMTVTGGKAAWAGAGSLDLRYRIKDPTGTQVLTGTSANVVEGVGTLGKFVSAPVIAAADVNLDANGAHNVYLDWDDVAVPTWPAAQQSIATTSFNIYVTDKISYERTSNVYARYYVPAGKTVDQWVLTKPDGSTVTTAIAPVVGAAFTLVLNPLATVKDTPLGTYNLKLKNSGTGDTIISQDFAVTAANFGVAIIAAADLQDTSSKEAAANIVAANQPVERMHTVVTKYTITYPDASVVTTADVQAGFDVKVYYNSTLVTTFKLDPLTAYQGAGVWKASWLIPKDAVKGKGYTMNVTAASIADIYGNTGPKKNYGSMSIFKFKVVAGTIYVTQAANLLYPSAGNQIERTTEARTSVEVRYADNSRVTGAGLGQFNVTANTALGAKTYIIKPVAADYNTDIGLWVVKWKTPYNAPIQNDYVFTVAGNNFKDAWGNKGPDYTGGHPGQAAQANSGAFGIKVATITVSDVKTDFTSYETDDQVVVTFKASYPSGDPVTTANTVPANTWQKVDIIDSGGAVIGGATKQATYNSATKLWKLTFIIPTGSVGGKYNATVKANYVDDGAGNVGPAVKKYANFEVARVSLTQVYEASNLAKASADLAKAQADLAKVAADAAKTAADAALAAATTAGTKADAAKTAADAATAAATAAGTKADAATTAANAAKTAADAAGTKATAAETAAKAAQTAATDAGTKATSAETAAKAAQTAATGATTSADAAKKAADAATAAATAAKTSADAASAKIDSLQTLVYGAIGASLIAAAAAIVALMQISRKIA